MNTCPCRKRITAAAAAAHSTLTQPELSARIGQRKRDNIVASGAEVVAMGCPACMMQISDMLARNHDPIKVKHTIEIYADSLS